MTETADREKWDTFFKSGSVTDYLDYKGITFSRSEHDRKECSYDNNHGGSRNFRK